jgi:signal transduction histidine kinase
VIVDDATARAGKFASDPYFARRRTRSVLCLPILRQEPIGLLYLENDLVAGAFTPDRLTVLSLLASQTAISVENARLYREVQRADRRKSEFIAVLSHELRNPLAPIRTGLQLVRRSPPGSPIASRAWEIIARQTEHLSLLVDDLLDITRVSHGKIELHRARIDLRDVVRSSCDDLVPLFERGTLTLHLELPPGPLWVEADATRVAQVVGNLLQNAVKFTPAGGSVTVNAAAGGGRAEISVRDTGVGMDASELERMFEPFAQAEQGLARTMGGLGLGLALAKALVELHGGSIQARSEGRGRGSEFVVSLPLAA